MLNKIYNNPFKVYLTFFLLTMIGLLALTSLPISLYPEATKPVIEGNISYGPLSRREFLEKYGSEIETSLLNIKEDNLKVDLVSSSYEIGSLNLKVTFQWNNNSDKAQKKVSEVLRQLSSKWPKESQEDFWVGRSESGNGFVAILFSSNQKSPLEIYREINPLLSQEFSSINDLDHFNFSRDQEEVRVILKPEITLQMGLYPRDIEQAIQQNMESYRGGNLKKEGNELIVQFESGVKSIEHLKNLLITIPTGEMIPLSHLANIMLVTSKDEGIVKLNLHKGLMLIATPKPSGNLDRLASDIFKGIKNREGQFSQDIKTHIVINPSEFIQSSVYHVFFEVCLSGLLAVLVLFLFVGDLKNTLLAAVEIPLSLVLAFILMKFFKVNINLISLGGLALSTGMNVDASVVIIDSIIHRWQEMEKNPSLTLKERIEQLMLAVRGVILPLFSSTLCSLAVFAPLIFIGGIGGIILCDLAKTICFSHACSLGVAIILVPTVRFHMLGSSFFNKKQKTQKVPLEALYNRLESLYSSFLSWIFSKKTLYRTFPLMIFVSFALMALLLFPHIPKNLIEKPDTDWAGLLVKVPSYTKMEQMETLFKEYYNELRSPSSPYAPHIRHIFTNIFRKNSGVLLIRIQNKKEMKSFLELLEKRFVTTPEIKYEIFDWNPANLPIPKYPNLKISLYGSNREDNLKTVFRLGDYLKEGSLTPSPFTRIETTPYGMARYLTIRPKVNQIESLKQFHPDLNFSLFSQTVRLAMKGKKVGEISNPTLIGETYPLYLRYPENYLSERDQIAHFPFKIGNNFIPFMAFAHIQETRDLAEINRENGQEIFQVLAYKKESDTSPEEESNKLTREVLQKFTQEEMPTLSLKTPPKIIMDDPQKEMNDSMTELLWVVVASVGLIFIILLFFFQNIIQSLIIMSAIPFGIIGVVYALFLFNSNLSLNSVLGIIILNGLSVANSILIVDFINKKFFEEHLSPQEATLLVTKNRLRPILITSLTTILGMLPMAIGLGDGGKVLRPLGISVSGGLWVSMLCTLLVVPLMQTFYLEKRQKIKS